MSSVLCFCTTQDLYSVSQSVSQCAIQCSNHSINSPFWPAKILNCFLLIWQQYRLMGCHVGTNRSRNSIISTSRLHIDGLDQGRRNSTALAMESRVSHINPLIYAWVIFPWNPLNWLLAVPDSYLASYSAVLLGKLTQVEITVSWTWLNFPKKP